MKLPLVRGLVWPNKLTPGSAVKGLLAMILVVLANVVLAEGKLTIMDSHPAILLSAEAVKERDISGYLKVWVDATNSLPLDQVIKHQKEFMPLDDLDGADYQGSTSYWLYGRVRKSNRNAFGADTNWRLVIPGYHIVESQFFIRQKIGESFVDVAPLDARYLVYPLKLDMQNTAEFYLKVTHRGVFNAPVRIWEEQAYLLAKRKSTLGWGLFFGSILALFLYNLFVFISLREAGYFYLCGFLVSAFWVSGVTENFVATYLPQWVVGDNLNVSMALQWLALFFASGFSRHFLSTPQRFAGLEKLLLSSMAISAVMGVVSILGWFPASVFQVLFPLVSALFFVPAVVGSLQISDRSSRFFLVGWSLFVVGYTIYQLGDWNIIPFNSLTMRSKEFALCLLGVFLSLGIAAQIQRERFAKDKGLSKQKETMMELKIAEEQIQKKMLRDTLQVYPDKHSLAKVAERSIASLSEGQESLTLVLVELLHLELVQTQLGHAALNELMTRATRRLSIVLRSIVGVVPISESEGHYILMSALGNGQYAFLLKGMDNNKVNLAVEEVEVAMQKPFFYQGVALSPGVCFGVSRATDQDASYKTLYSHCLTSLLADKARLQSKHHEIETINQYSPRNISLINRLREAIQEDQLSLYFQSTYALKSQKVSGIEVLCRWDGLKNDSVSPHEIFYLAEVGGFVSELTLKVIEKAIQHYLVAVDITKNKVKISINISPKCIRDGRFLEQVSLLLEHYQMPGNLMAFEIKESSIIEDPSITREALNQIRAMGIGLTIDEFGAAYSNPSYLSGLPVNEVKLDPRMLVQLDKLANREAITGVIQLCREYSIKLVVHGVENESTLSKLEEMGCGFAQGHYLSQPIKANQYHLPDSESRKSRYIKVS